ncbi:type II toxin-antitoxin system PemK/MazF family toxin [Flavobacterium sp.]|uniref:type II toxin-antitoxin system PemK/MazF family toxin n=1 Tax=Flavobacterium sp. TaxID=239 RepID=UPI00286AA112|nr:type II toxin-antitoxin system PemK/MazF family toxin [Flavobacterium sp.]
MELIQYSIILVNLDPTLGSEIQKTSLCVIVSPNEMNKYLKTIVICPMTTNTKEYPTRVAVKNDGRSGMIIIDQIRTIDKSRIVKVFGKLNLKEIKMCKEIIKETFVD